PFKVTGFFSVSFASTVPRTVTSLASLSGGGSSWSVLACAIIGDRAGSAPSAEPGTITPIISATTIVLIALLLLLRELFGLIPPPRPAGTEASLPPAAAIGADHPS